VGETSDLLTSTQAAALAGVSRHTILMAARTGRLPCEETTDYRLRRSGGGRALLFRRADIETYKVQADATKARIGHGLSNAERQRRKYAKKKAESSS